ncbi:MAG: hypothetical protein WKG07_23665 [Hymenobacter sp.]
MSAAARTGTDRIELYTEAYARHYPTDRAAAVLPSPRHRPRRHRRQPAA